MKKLILLSMFCLIAVIGFSQSITIMNNTGSVLMVGVQAEDDQSVCSWVSVVSGIPLLPGPNVIPLGGFLYAYRVGVFDPVSLISGHDTCPSWNTDCANSSGPFTFIWNGCNYVEVN